MTSEQAQVLLRIVNSAQINTTVGQLMSGPTPEIREAIQALQDIAVAPEKGKGNV